MGSKKIMPDLEMVRTARLKELAGVFLRIWTFKKIVICIKKKLKYLQLNNLQCCISFKCTAK